MPMTRMKRRKEFVRTASSGFHASYTGLALQARVRRNGEYSAPEARVGFTTSKKVGNAVKRNRARRRLRQAAENILSGNARPDLDYVIVGKAATVDRTFDRLETDLAKAIDTVHAKIDKRAAKQQGRLET